MDSMERLKALAWAARERGITYGQLSAALKPGEEEKICRQYEAWKRKRAADLREERERRKNETAKTKRAGRQPMTVKTKRTAHPD